jgi:hypothetical protein
VLIGTSTSETFVLVQDADKQNGVMNCRYHLKKITLYLAEFNRF